MRKDRGMGCTLVTHLRLPNYRFCVFYVEINHFEAYLMVSSREVDSKVLTMAIQSISFFIKRQNGECYACKTFRRFLFSMSPDVRF